jgi:hypothetical protein
VAIALFCTAGCGGGDVSSPLSPAGAGAGAGTAAGSAGTDDAGTAATPTNEPPADPAAALFDPEHVLGIDIELAQADWDVLRHEGRSLVDVFNGCAPEDFAYTYFPATVTVDGETLGEVGVRKKGYIGSLSTVRPSFKINFAHFLPEQRFRGVKRLTLNNDRQDASHTHQCMSYAMFAAAGLPAPRCNHARVHVNGVDMGVYTHVESIKKPFLERAFGNGDGNLYEGQGADLLDGFVERLEIKNNETTNDRSDAYALADALTVPDDQLEAALGEHLDLDRFLGFWAVEVLTSHWDGYTGDLNNFFLYNDPATGFAFIPWGTDGAYGEHAFLPSTIPASVYAMSHLARRLYEYEPTRARYRERLRELLDTLWLEAPLLAEVDRIAALADGDAVDSELDAQRAFLRAQRGRIEAELDGPAPTWTFPPRAPSACADRSFPVSATFDTTWGDLDMASSSTANTLVVDDATTRPDFTAVLASAGIDVEAEPPAPAVRVVGLLPTGLILVVQVALGAVPFEAGEVPLHGVETVGALVEAMSDGSQPRVLGLISGGSLVLEAADSTDGAPVRGRFEGHSVSVPGLAL